MTNQTFSEFQIEPEIREALELLGYVKPTPIQEAVLPFALAGRDVVGQSQTGSGKTAAFAIPICSKVIWNELLPQALILEPTRELAVQVQDEIFQISRKKRLKVPVIFGGMPVEKQAITLKQRSHIVVGTPGRVIDHMERGNLILDQIKYLVIDEADLMLDMGFMEDVEYIVAHTGGGVKPQVMLFSATMEQSIDHLVEHYMTEPESVVVESDGKTAEGITQYAYHTEQEEKFDALLSLMMLENPENAIIFCDTREMVNTLFQKLRRKKIRCGMLHGAMEQRDRLYAISDFRKGIYHYLITTDVAARGIDLPDITHVINYDFPTKLENYVHRIGRTARNGQTGKAFSFVSAYEEHYKKAVEEYIGLEIPWAELPGREEVQESSRDFLKRQKEKVVIKEGKGAVYKEDIQKLSIGGGRKSKLRAGDVVGAICAIEGISQEDIGVIDVRDSITYVEILNRKGNIVLQKLQEKPIKGKIRKVKNCSD